MFKKSHSHIAINIKIPHYDKSPEEIHQDIKDVNEQAVQAIQAAILSLNLPSGSQTEMMEKDYSADLEAYKEDQSFKTSYWFCFGLAFATGLIVADIAMITPPNFWWVAVGCFSCGWLSDRLDKCINRARQDKGKS